MEKESILNSYKLFLKTCNFDIQILIQSSKENINQHIKKIKNNIVNENTEIKNIANNYFEYIKKENISSKSSSKNFFILIKEKSNKSDINLIKEKLNTNYLKIKECLSRCGNSAYDINNKQEILSIIQSFIKTK